MLIHSAASLESDLDGWIMMDVLRVYIDCGTAGISFLLHLRIFICEMLDNRMQKLLQNDANNAN